MTSLRGKVAVVSGASSGVGKATVQALVGEGVRVTAVAAAATGCARCGPKLAPASRPCRRTHPIRRSPIA